MYGGLINISPQHTLDLKEFCYFSIFCIILLSLSDNIVIHFSRFDIYYSGLAIFIVI